MAVTREWFNPEVVQPFRSVEHARREFETYAELEPRLRRLWLLCQTAAPPVAANDENDDDPFDVDLYDVDFLATTARNEDWCAEQFFLQQIKPQLTALVGWARIEGAPELRGQEAYDVTYSALFFHALNRTCICCREPARRLRA